MAKNAATLPRAAAPAAGQRSRQRTRPRPFSGRFSPRCGTMPPTASAKWPATRPPSTAPCAPASTGSWGRLRCGMRPGVRVDRRRMKALGLPVSARVEALLGRPDSRFLVLAATAAQLLPAGDGTAGAGRRNPRPRPHRRFPPLTNGGGPQPTPALRSSISATASAASSCTRSRTPSAATCWRWSRRCSIPIPTRCATLPAL